MGQNRVSQDRQPEVRPFTSRRTGEGDLTSEDIPRDFEASAASRADVLRAAAWIEERVLAQLSDVKAPPGLLRQLSDSFIRLQGDVNRLEQRLIEAEEATAARIGHFLDRGRRFRQVVIVLLLVIAGLLSALLLQLSDPSPPDAAPVAETPAS